MSHQFLEAVQLAPLVAQVGGQPLETGVPRGAGVLPPRTSPEGIVASYLSSSAAGLPSVATQAAYETTPYKPHLSVDFVGQPMIGVGVAFLIDAALLGFTAVMGGFEPSDPPGPPDPPIPPPAAGRRPYPGR